MRAALYARLSVMSEDKANIPQQLEHGREACERNGWEIVGEYVDDGVSAWKASVTRPGFEAMAEVVREGKVDVIVVRDVDRLTRSLADWVKLKGGVEIASHSGTVMSAAEVGMKAVWAEEESAVKSRRQLLAEERRVAAGKPPRGPRHFGYTVGYHEIVPEEAEILREVAERWLEGEALRALARDMTERGYRTSRDNDWSYRSLQKILTSPTPAAIRVVDGVEHEGEWPAIFSPEMYAALQQVDRASPMKGRRAPERYLLTGLLFCGRCGDQLNGKKHTETSRRYSCRSCHRVGIATEPVDAWLWNQALARAWAEDEGVRGETASSAEEVERDLAARRETLQELDDAYWQRRAVPKETYYRQVGELRTAVERLEERLAGLREEAGRSRGYWSTLMRLAETHDEATPLQRRRILERVLERVVVAEWDGTGAQAADLDRLEVEWSM